MSHFSQRQLHAMADLRTCVTCAGLFADLAACTVDGADMGIAGAAHVAKVVGGIRTALTAFVDAFKHIVEEEGYIDRCGGDHVTCKLETR